MSFDHHAAAASSAALRAAGIEPGAGGPDRVGENGVVERDARTGEATGLVLEDAAWAVWNAAPEAPPQRRRAQVRDALAHLHALGYREVHDMLAQDWLGDTIADLVASGETPGWESIRLYAPMDRFGAMLASSGRLGGTGGGGWEKVSRGVVRLAGGKLFADGTLNSRTALMLSAYGTGGNEPEAPAAPNFGTAMVTARQIDDAMEATERAGLHLAVHAIGDGAVRMVLDAAERARDRRKAHGEKHTGGGGDDEFGVGSHRIEHAELIDEADVGRFVRLGVVCSVQPCHLLYDIEVLRKYLGHRLERVLPMRDLIDSGLTPGEGLVFGSDAPIVRANAEDSVLAATMRRREGMAAHASIAPHQAISEAEAWACFHAR